jgi:hypothetical protein
MSIHFAEKFPPQGNCNGSANWNNRDNNWNWWSTSRWYRNGNNNGNVNRNQNDARNRMSTLTFKYHQPLLGKSEQRSFLFKLLYEAFQDASKRKHQSENQIEFELNLFDNLNKLTEEILNGTYKVMPPNIFVIDSPVKREIIAPQFRDRVVQHFVYNAIYEHVDNRLIYDCYSCRKGKGTSLGIKRAYGFMQSVSNNFKENAYVMKLDIKGYFMGIDKTILHESVLEMLLGWTHPLERFVFKTIETIIFSNPIENAKYTCNKMKWRGLPENKSLLHGKPGIGLPIGNLTSQMFGNIYLNKLDHFVKDVLKVRCYGRYVDDMIFLDKTRERLLDIKAAIGDFLKQLNLFLHSEKFYLQSIWNGFEFLGGYLKPYRIYPSKRIRKSFIESCRENIMEAIQKYAGNFRHLSARNLQASFCSSTCY